MSSHELTALSHPKNAASVTPHNTNRLENTGVLFIGGAGNVNVTTEAGQDVVFSNVLAGTFLPVRVTHVKATSTTATNLVVCW